MSSSNGEFFGTERFSIRRRVGAGGMGVVYEVYDRERDKIVALKTLLRADASAIYRFKKEFRSLADVSHPNLVSLYELIAEGDSWFFTMEMVKGVNFIEYVTRADKADADTDQAKVPTLPGFEGDTMPVGRAQTMPGSEPYAIPEGGETIDLQEMENAGEGFSSLARPALPPLPAHIERLRPALKQLAEGVCALHGMGKLHRDIKPSNVLVTEEGRVAILDFGLIMEMVAEGDTHSLQVVGTPAYMSPEQGAGRGISEASDWYSVGVILYEALTGRLPFTGQYVEVLLNKQKFEPPPPSQLVSEIPEDLDSLCRDLLRRDPSARPSGSEILKRLGVDQAEDGSLARPQAATARDAPFVGRERQMSALKDSFLATKSGRTVTLYIHGQSGMGKSALVRNFLENLRQSEKAVIVSGRCYERESVPYKALDGVIDSLSRYLMSLPTVKAEVLMPRDVLALSRLFPVMLRVDSVAGAPYREQEISDPLALRRRAFASLRELLTRLAERQPLVIYIDDLQWADADSTALLEDLLRPPDPPPLLLLASFRSEEIESKPFLKRMLAQAGSEDFRAIEVEPLTRDEARDLAHALLPREMPGAEHFVEAIVREASGSPFFVEQLTRYALTSERAATTGITLAEMLDAGLSQLPPGARDLLETLAVAGRPVDPDVAFDAAGLDGDAHALVTSLRASHFLRSSGSAQLIELYHDRIRETLTSLLDPARVRGIHASLARTLESRGIEDPEALFEHYLGAGERKLAAAQAFLAAKRADAALAFDRAAVFYRNALQLGPIKGTNIVDVKGGLGDALANAGRSAEAAEAYLDAALDSDAEKGLDFQRRAAAQLLMGGHIDEGLDVIRTLLEAVDLQLASGPKRALLSLILRRAHLRLRGIDFKERDEAQVSRDDLLKIDICWSVAAGLGMVDNIRAADFQTRGLLLALQAGEPYRIARALAFEAAFSASPGGPDMKRPAKYLKAAESLARKVDDPHAMGLVTFTEGMAAYLAGEWKKAVRLCDQASEILRDRCTGAVWELSSSHRITLSALMLMGELGEISRRLPGLLAAAKEQGNLYAATDLRTRLNIMWLAADDPDEGRKEVIDALLEWSQGGFHVQHYNSLQAMAQIELYTGDGVVAWKHITGQWQTIRKSMLLRIQILRVEALFLQGRCALAAAREQKDGQFLKMSEYFAGHLARERMHWTRPLLSLIRAGMAGVREDHKSAAAFLSEAAAGFDAADMKLYAAAARRQMGRVLGGDRGRELISRSDLWMQSQMIKNPARLTHMLAPGFALDSSDE